MGIQCNAKALFDIRRHLSTAKKVAVADLLPYSSTVCKSNQQACVQERVKLKDDLMFCTDVGGAVTCDGLTQKTPQRSATFLFFV